MPEKAVEEWPEGKDFRPSVTVDTFLELGGVKHFILQS